MIFAIISVAITIISLIAIAFNLIKEKFYPFVIYVVALFAVYSTTMLGVGVVGSDISAEVFRSKEAFAVGWNITADSAEVTSFVVGWLVPVLSKILFIDVVWVYKIVLPMIFALCPTILYLVYTKQINRSKAFLGAMFFIIMPVYSIEMATIGKSMVAEVFLATAIYAIVSDWNKWIKFIVIFLSLALSLWAHYSVGIMGLAIFLVIAIVLLVTQFMKKWELWQNRSTKWWMIVVAVVSVAFMGYIYLGVAGGGWILRTINIVNYNYSGLFKRVETGNFTITGEYKEPPKVVSNITTPTINKTLTVKDTYLNQQGKLVRTAIGLDFNETTNLGKIFRIIQFVTQLLIVLGCIYILFRYKKYKLRAEFIAGIGAGAGILFLCIFIPYISTILNMTRFYHLSLFFLAPTIVFGVDAVMGVICKKSQ